ncbi:hypothetical protein BBP40_007553 [Aspergillus hancockii]|nr:hypothetical protein BBP40_007553 [Aspergillus hancockii]
MVRTAWGLQAIRTGVYRISTAFEARFSVTAGDRTICYNAEYDALPELGHACGHNLIATSTLASAVGVSAAMKALNIPGTLIVMGTPAEETGGGKYIINEPRGMERLQHCPHDTCNAGLLNHQDGNKSILEIQSEDLREGCAVEWEECLRCNRLGI